MRCVTALFLAATLSGCASFQIVRMAGPPTRSTPRAKAINHYLVATIEQRNGRFEEAVTHFRLAQEYAPDSPALTRQLIRLHLLLHDFDSALVLCERAVKQWPDDPTLWFVLGSVNRRLERYDAASEALKRAIAISPDNVLGYEELVRAEEEANDLIATIDIYERLVELRPDSADLHFRLGLNLAQIKQVPAARDSILRALELNPAHTRARYVLALLCMDLGEHECAIAHLERCVSETPEDLSARENLAAAHARAGDDPRAVEILAALAQLPDAQPRHTLGLMYLLLRSGHSLEAAAVVPPNDAPVFGTLLRACARRAVGEPYRALLRTLDDADADVDQECSEYLPELLHFSTREEAGRTLLGLIEPLRAEQPAPALLEVVYARLLMGLDRHDEAAPLLESLLARPGPHKWVHYYLAMIYEKLERPADAERHLKACLELDPEDPDVMNFLGYLYAEENIHLDEAERLLNRALELDPENGFYLDSLGWIYYRQGKADLAVEYIRRAIVRMDADDAVLRDHLGDAYLLKGEIGKAVAEWERARRLDPDLEGIQEKIDKHRPRDTGR